MRWKGFAGWALLAALPLGACRTASIYRPAVQLQLAVSPAQLSAGDTARFQLTVTNPGRDTVVLEFDGDCRVTFIVMNPDQRAVEGSDAECAEPRPGRVVLAAGARWSTSHAWAASAADGTPLPPGSYLVRGVLGEHDSVVRRKREFKMSHAAETVAIRILPAGG